MINLSKYIYNDVIILAHDFYQKIKNKKIRTWLLHLSAITPHPGLTERVSLSELRKLPRGKVWRQVHKLESTNKKPYPIHLSYSHQSHQIAATNIQYPLSIHTPTHKKGLFFSLFLSDYRDSSETEKGKERKQSWSQWQPHCKQLQHWCNPPRWAWCLPEAAYSWGLLRLCPSHLAWNQLQLDSLVLFKLILRTSPRSV